MICDGRAKTPALLNTPEPDRTWINYSEHSEKLHEKRRLKTASLLCILFRLVGQVGFDPFLTCKIAAKASKTTHTKNEASFVMPRFSLSEPAIKHIDYFVAYAQLLAGQMGQISNPGTSFFALFGKVIWVSHLRT